MHWYDLFNGLFSGLNYTYILKKVCNAYSCALQIIFNILINRREADLLCSCYIASIILIGTDSKILLWPEHSLLLVILSDTYDIGWLLIIKYFMNTFEKIIIFYSCQIFRFKGKFWDLSRWKYMTFYEINLCYNTFFSDCRTGSHGVTIPKF